MKLKILLPALALACSSAAFAIPDKYKNIDWNAEYQRLTTYMSSHIERPDDFARNLKNLQIVAKKAHKPDPLAPWPHAGAIGNNSTAIGPFMAD